MLTTSLSSPGTLTHAAIMMAPRLTKWGDEKDEHKNQMLYLNSIEKTINERLVGCSIWPSRPYRRT